MYQHYNFIVVKMFWLGFDTEKNNLIQNKSHQGWDLYHNGTIPQCSNNTFFFKSEDPSSILKPADTKSLMKKMYIESLMSLQVKVQLIQFGFF